MDPVSQGVLGAALASTAASQRQLPVAAGVGLVAALAPDLDVLIQSSADPLLFLEYHRQFSHALIFAPLGALLCAGILHGLVHRRLAFAQTYLFCLLGYTSHGLLDACTSYGTQLLWPFSDTRIAWNIIAVVDPLFTLPLAALLIAALIRRQSAPARVAISISAFYLALGFWQNSRAEDVVEALAATRGHQPERLLVKPSFGNLLVWKLIYATDGRFHVDAARMGIEVQILPGSSVEALDPERDFPWLHPSSRQARDLQRFSHFSSGYLALDQGNRSRVTDIRYSMLPNEIDGLWGIDLHPTTPDGSVTFFSDRTTTPAQRQALMRLLLSVE